jgi:hypothetical protein
LGAASGTTGLSQSAGPVSPRAATLTRIVELRAFRLHSLRVACSRLSRSTRLRLWLVTGETHLAVPSLAADFRRTRVQYLASHGGNRSPFSGAFSFFAVHFRARRRRQIYLHRAESINEIDFRGRRHPHRFIKGSKRAICAVEKSVDKMISVRAIVIPGIFLLT